MLFDRYSSTPYTITPRRRFIPPVKCAPSPAACPQSNAPRPVTWPLDKARTKLPILPAYPYLTAISISVARCAIRIRGWQFSVGLNQRGKTVLLHIVGCTDGSTCLRSDSFKLLLHFLNTTAFTAISNYAINWWRGGLVVGRRTCDLVVAGSRPSRDAAA